MSRDFARNAANRTWSEALLGGVMWIAAAGCAPLHGTMPAAMWRPEAPGAQCSSSSLADTHGRAWSPAGRALLEARREAGEPAVVSAIGCRVDVLEHCRVRRAEDGSVGANDPTEDIRVGELEGDCTGATHFVTASRDAGTGEPTSDAPWIELTPLSLEGFDLSGKWTGVMHQPNGPYERYSMTLDIVQNGPRVTGVSHLRSSDHENWGDLRFEGRLVGNTLFFADAEVIDDHTLPFLAWCAKGGYFLVDPHDETLEGPWTAPSCEPGTIDLHREPSPERRVVASPPVDQNALSRR